MTQKEAETAQIGHWLVYSPERKDEVFTHFTHFTDGNVYIKLNKPYLIEGLDRQEYPLNSRSEDSPIILEIYAYVKNEDDKIMPINLFNGNSWKLLTTEEEKQYYELLYS